MTYPISITILPLKYLYYKQWISYFYTSNSSIPVRLKHLVLIQLLEQELQMALSVLDLLPCDPEICVLKHNNLANYNNS